MSAAFDIAEKLKALTGTVGITYFCVALGSAIGGSARYALSGVVANWIGATFPWGTLIINITGSFVIGIFNTLTAVKTIAFMVSHGRYGDGWACLSRGDPEPALWPGQERSLTLARLGAMVWHD